MSSKPCYKLEAHVTDVGDKSSKVYYKSEAFASDL